MKRQALKLSFLILFSIFLSNCSSTEKRIELNPMTTGEKGYLQAIVAQIPSRWFDTAKRFKLTDQQNNIAKHFFWDVNPEINYKNKTLNFVVTTVADSQFQYDLDINSGQLYTSNKYCPQSDVWKKYNSVIDKPPFTQGVVPRVLDQLMEPQQIIIFGNNDYYRQNFKTNFFDAKIIGSFVMQSCPRGACLEPDSWNSKMILVGIQPQFEKYLKVKNLNDLKKIEDWDSVIAFLENGNGRNVVANNVYPAFKYGTEISVSQTMYFLKKQSKHFLVSDLKNLKISCYRLYDYLWKNLSYEEKDDIKDVKNENKSRIYNKKEKSKNLLLKKPFHERFIQDFKKYNREFYTCSKYVYNSNINYNLDRFHFFAYFDALSKVNSLGNYYSCNRKVWIENPLVENNKRYFQDKDLFLNCSARDIDIAFESSIKYLKDLNQNHRKTYRFIDYDRGAQGTHNKLYSWVPVHGRKYECSNSEDKNISNNYLIFPTDIKWKKREKHIKYDAKSLGKIIE